MNPPHAIFGASVYSEPHMWKIVYIYAYIYKHISIYIYAYIRTYSVYAFCPICTLFDISKCHTDIAKPIYKSFPMKMQRHSVCTAPCNSKLSTNICVEIFQWDKLGCDFPVITVHTESKLFLGKCSIFWDHYF